MYDSKEKAGERIKVRTDIKWAAAVMLMAVLCFSTIVAVKGYGLYREAIDSMSPEDKVASIHAEENYATFDRFPETYVDAVLSVENHRSYSHPGIGMIAIGRAVLNDIKAGSFVEGASMVTQQLAKNVYFSQKKKLVRKTAEAPVASDSERSYSKNEIPELYMNTIYYGNGYYCVKDASSGHFGKEPEDMADHESTLLAGVPNAPSCYVPTVSQELTVRHRQQALDRLVKCGYFTEERALETMVVGSSR